MNNTQGFEEVPANINSLSKRRLVCGVGVNDADYMVHFIKNGIKIRCVYHATWTAMLKRCYSEACQKRQPAYIGCSVCDKWLIFSNFKAWMEKQDFKGKHLDKDIKIKGNKVYSPEACSFVSAAENVIAASAKNYIFISPSGAIVPVYNLRKFCRDNRLNASNMCQVSKGRLSQHKGWVSHG